MLDGNTQLLKIELRRNFFSVSVMKVFRSTVFLLKKISTSDEVLLVSVKCYSKVKKRDIFGKLHGGL